MDKIDLSKVIHLSQLMAARRASRNISLPTDIEPLPLPIIFIFSPPRSGSTLLRTLLAGHPGLFAPPELQLLSFDTLKNRQVAFSGHSNFRLEGTIRAVMALKECSAEQATQMLAEYEYQNLTVPQFYHLMQRWCDEKILVDKSPSYTLSLDTLKRAEIYFENALYIHLIRHPYGMIRSFEAAKFEQLLCQFEHGFTARELAELIWLISQQNIMTFLQDIPAHRQYQIRFEELVNNSCTTLESLCHFLGLEFHSEMLQPYQDKKQRMTDGINSTSLMLGDPKFHQHNRINPAVAEQWKKAYQNDFLGDITIEIANKLGYDELVNSESRNQRIPHAVPS